MAVGANRYTTAELISYIRNVGHVPSSQNGFDDSTLLTYADAECQTAIFRQVKSIRENYWLTYVDEVVNGTGLYDIPSRAIGGGLADIQLVVGTAVLSIARCEVGEQFSTVTSPSGYYQYTLIGNQFSVSPNPTTGVIRQWFYCRPNNLVKVTQAAQITAIDPVTFTLTFSSVPSTFQSTLPYDIIKDQPFFDWLSQDLVAVNITTTTAQFSSLPSNVVVGDWLALAGQTPVPQIPVEARPLLAQRVVVKYNEIQGYLDKMKAAQKKLDDMEKDLFDVLQPRVAEEPKRIVPDSNLIGGYRRWRAWRAT